jgi:RimJ/RimL family protein N-acetyltransferase
LAIFISDKSELACIANLALRKGTTGLVRTLYQTTQILYKKHCEHGLGSELGYGILKYCFEKLSFVKITADIDIENIAAVKILKKIMFHEKEYYNKEDKCIDRRYQIKRKDWLQL